MYLDLCAMNYICVLLSRIALACCSSLKFDDPNNIEFNNGNGKATFNLLRYDMIRHIATFIEPEDIVNWRYVNCLTLSSLSLKRLVEQTFDISGLECISDNEPELAGVLRLARISHDPFLLFKFLINDVVKGKKPYDVLFSALILHLFKTFSGLGFKEKQECQRYSECSFNSNVESCMIIACLNKGHFDLAIGIVKDNPGLSGKALQSAAELGHIPVVEFLLQLHTDIPADYVGLALQGASENGHIPIIQLLLQHQNDIPVAFVGFALSFAASNGQAQIVQLLLQCQNYIPADRVGFALSYAAGNGYIPIVQLLLQHQNDIPADRVGCALKYAADYGHTSIVELLLQSRTDIPADYVGWALRYAAESGHIPIVQLLLQHQNDITADRVGCALKYAADYGRTSIVELLLRSRTDIPADYVGWALQGASENEHTSIVELIHSRNDLSADHVGRALNEAGYSCFFCLIS
jgi:ankyrin repeat protein